MNKEIDFKEILYLFIQVHTSNHWPKINITKNVIAQLQGSLRISTSIKKI